jgi:HK97 family phage major capsid protein
MQAFFGNEKARQYCQENGVFSYGTQQVIYNVQEEGSTTTGGALVPDEMERSIIDLREEYGEFRKYAKIVPMGSDYKTQPRRTSGLTAYPIAESAAFIESTKGWDSVSWTAKKWGVLAKYSDELGEDAIINIADDLTDEASYAFAVAEDNAGINGDGTGTYNGITGLQKKFFDANAAAWTKVVVSTATHDLFSEIDGDDIDKLIALLPKYARRNAKFYISPVGKTLVFDPILRAAGGNTQGDIASAHQRNTSATRSSKWSRCRAT